MPDGRVPEPTDRVATSTAACSCRAVPRVFGPAFGEGLWVDPCVGRPVGFPVSSEPLAGVLQRRLLRVPAVPYHVSLRPALWNCGLIPASGGRSGSQYRRSSCCLGDDLQSSPPTSRVYIILLPRTTYRHWQDFAAQARHDASHEHLFTTTVWKNLSLMEH